VIFAIGMMALAQLQGNLTRSSANANVRTVATNIAEETIEGLRGFAYLESDPAGILPGYADITTGTGVTVTRGGIVYTVTTTVSDWYYDITSDTFMGWTDYVEAHQARVGGNSLPPDAYSDFKLVSVNVTWDDTRPWLIDEATTFTTDTGITLAAVISSMSTAGSAKVATSSEPDFFTPYVDYSPGQNPDIIRLALGDSKFKESLTPEPRVFRVNELVETRFDVITYSQSEDGALFVRREEFVAVNCECELRAPPGDAQAAGRRPTLWSGDEYNEALFVDKPYGVTNLSLNAQSAFCDTCCQDHHDGGTHEDDLEAGARKYDPFPNSSREYWESGAFAGDHKHYYPDANGVLQEVAADGGVYLESCALVRRDGFMRVTQDFNQEGVNVFAQDFLDDTAEVGVYSGYVTGAVNAYAGGISYGYETSPPSLPPPLTGVEAGDLWSDYTTLPLTIGGGGGFGDPGLVFTQQQLRDRGIYISYVRNDLQSVMSCVAGGTAVEDCESNDVKLDQTGSSNILEILPFFDLQLTFLSRWNEKPINNPVDTTNETIVTGNLHSRGVAFPGGRQGPSLVSAKGNPGNQGLTDTDPIEPNFRITTATITVESLAGDDPWDPALPVVSGTITSSVGGILDVTTVVIDNVVDASCDRTPDGFSCLITGPSPQITLGGFGRDTKDDVVDRVGCSTTLTKLNESFSDINPWVIFSLAGASEEVLHNINIAKAFVCS
jgi:Tfp pilus assembly protein PilV